MGVDREKLKEEIEVALRPLWPSNLGLLSVTFLYPQLGLIVVRWDEALAGRIIGTPICDSLVKAVVNICKRHEIYEDGVDFGDYAFEVRADFDKNGDEPYDFGDSIVVATAAVIKQIESAGFIVSTTTRLECTEVHATSLKTGQVYTARSQADEDMRIYEAAVDVAEHIGLDVDEW